MVGVILPDCGGTWVPDTGGGGTGTLPTAVMKHLLEHGKRGVVLSGLVAWIEVQIDTLGGCDTWRPIAERNWLDCEVTAAKEALKEVCGQELLTLVPDFKTNRQGTNKKHKELEDIMKAVVALQNNNSMPLVIASSDMMGRCPSGWGQPDSPTSQDIMGKVHMLEEAMSSFMDQQRKQMDKVCQELATVRVMGPRTPGLVNTNYLDSPSKKRKVCPEGTTAQLSYAGATMSGVKPLAPQQEQQQLQQGQQLIHQGQGQVHYGQPHQQQQASMRVIQSLMQHQHGSTPRQQKNICYGTAKTAGEEGDIRHLAANIDLVASGVSKDCSEDDLKEFLKSKEINAVAVETLTRDEVLQNVRTKTFKITVTPAEYESALKPEVWPYRVAVRHYRAPKRTDTSWSNQSGRAGGVVDRGGQVGGGNSSANGAFLQGSVRPRQAQSHQQLPDPVQLQNLFGILGQLGSREMPIH